MPHSEAVKELIAAAESLEEHMLALAPPFNRLWDTQEFHRLRRARLAVKAEEKPQTQADCPKCGHEWSRHSDFLRRCTASLGLDAAGDSEECDCEERPPSPIHPIGGTNGK